MAIHDSTNFAPAIDGAMDEPLGGRLKRTFDFVAALLAIILLAPLMLMVSALIIILDGGPAIIRHERIGRGGVRFGCFKFRTMVTNGDDVLRAHLQKSPEALVEWTKTRKLVSDPRITQLGLVLRKTSIDELPQIFNILLGEMSFVGPRPIVAEEIHKYGSVIAQYQRARPGLTGSWQISGRNDIRYEDRVELDRSYIENWTFKRDVEIILKTIPAVIKAKGVY